MTKWLSRVNNQLHTTQQVISHIKLISKILYQNHTQINAHAKKIHMPQGYTDDFFNSGHYITATCSMWLGEFTYMYMYTCTVHVHIHVVQRKFRHGN